MIRLEGMHPNLVFDLRAIIEKLEKGRNEFISMRGLFGDGQAIPGDYRAHERKRVGVSVKVWRSDLRTAHGSATNASMPQTPFLFHI